MGIDSPNSANITDHLVYNDMRKYENESFQKYENLNCYDEDDMMSMITFLFYFSSSMNYIVITIAVVGILLNLTGAYILSSRKSMKNTFNRLLISLYYIDSLFLVAYIYLNLTLTHIKSQYPINTILSKWIKIFYSFAFKCSIFLTVGISHERYIAMQYPSIKIDEVGAGRQLRKRLLTYILPIIATSIILVTPEYLENEIVWVLRNASNAEQNSELINTR